MKKLLLLTILFSIWNVSAYAKTLDERIANVEAKYEQRISKIDNMRGTDARKEVLKKHARQDTDLKIAHLKDLEALKKKPSKKAK